VLKDGLGRLGKLSVVGSAYLVRHVVGCSLCSSNEGSKLVSMRWFARVDVVVGNGPGRYCSPRERIPVSSKTRQLNTRVLMTCGEICGRPYSAATSFGRTFDSDVKRFRFTSSVVYDAASLIEMITPFYPQRFLLLATIANVGKSVVRRCRLTLSDLC